MRKANYDLHPTVSVPDSQGKCVAGWDDISQKIQSAVAGKERAVVAVECYPCVDVQTIKEALCSRLNVESCLDSVVAMKSALDIDALCEPFLGGDDPIFGWLSGLTLPQFFDDQKVEEARASLGEAGLILIIGPGATLLCPTPDVLVYADMPRWEGQLRYRRNEVSNLGVSNRDETASLQYKRAFFIDWRVCDEWKKPLISRWDFVLDTVDVNQPKMADGSAVREGLQAAATRPFRVVPFFDPAPWGGQWMKEVCGLDPKPDNYGWCFDCVPEENSLLLEIDGITLEVPSINLVFDRPVSLLGEKVHARFGDEFPIRFDFLDTMGGGHLSFQVHPLTEYIQKNFGMHYTQDESYYMLDCGKEATVYLGVKTGTDPDEMRTDLMAAQRGEKLFDDERFVNQWPAKKHDHFLIPAGTCHCSGSESMVLEISATPYIFTFKMWDWNRLGLDGNPRPINVERGMDNIQFDRDTEWTKKNLINCFEPVSEGVGWREERTGLHEREFIETRRHWFSKTVPHHTDGGVNVLNLIEGDEAIVESPDGEFEPFIIHYAETFIVPASVGPYTIRPHGPSEGCECATLKAFVRT